MTRAHCSFVWDALNQKGLLQFTHSWNAKSWKVPDGQQNLWCIYHVTMSRSTCPTCPRKWSEREQFKMPSSLLEGARHTRASHNAPSAILMGWIQTVTHSAKALAKPWTSFSGGYFRFQLVALLTVWCEYHLPLNPSPTPGNRHHPEHSQQHAEMAFKPLHNPWQPDCTKGRLQPLESDYTKITSLDG